VAQAVTDFWRVRYILFGYSLLFCSPRPSGWQVFSPSTCCQENGVCRLANCTSNLLTRFQDGRWDSKDSYAPIGSALPVIALWPICWWTGTAWLVLLLQQSSQSSPLSPRSYNDLIKQSLSSISPPPKNHMAFTMQPYCWSHYHSLVTRTLSCLGCHMPQHIYTHQPPCLSPVPVLVSWLIAAIYILRSIPLKY
jgi:hypothetical protein